MVDFSDLGVLTAHWLGNAPLPVAVQWLGHASVRISMQRIEASDIVVYVDPRNLPDAPHDATLVCVTHSHGDHYAPADIGKVWKDDTVFVAPPDVIAAYGRGEALAPAQTFTLPDVSVTGVPAYNTNKPNHPKANNWLGYVVEIGSKRVYVAGDTDLIPEMGRLGHIDVAFLPAGGTYTMNAAEAAEATGYINPQLAIPYHWGEIVGTSADAEEFARLATCNVKVMRVGEILISPDWGQDFSLLAHWPLDEKEGHLVSDALRSMGAGLNGTPHWQPAGGVIGGAVQLDGINNYISTGFLLNPADGPFGIFAWVKTEWPGVVVSQKDGANWLRLEPTTGCLGTELQGIGRRSGPLWSQESVTDGTWHRVGLTWDGTSRILYVDDVEVARDEETTMKESNAGLRIGAGADLDPATLFAGLIDDVRLHKRAITPWGLDGTGNE